MFFTMSFACMGSSFPDGRSGFDRPGSMGSRSVDGSGTWTVNPERIFIKIDKAAAVSGDPIRRGRFQRMEGTFLFGAVPVEKSFSRPAACTGTPSICKPHRLHAAAMARGEAMDWKRLRTSVAPDGTFVFGVHRPGYRVANLREKDAVAPLGETADGRVVDNRANFPEGDIEAPAADPVVEIANPLPFRGATYILVRSADRIAQDPSAIALKKPEEVSMSAALKEAAPGLATADILRRLPAPVKLALAVSSNDPEDLVVLARDCAAFIDEPGDGSPTGLRFTEDGRPRIKDPFLFEAVANNPHLPDVYKEVMVLRPGAQGASEIVGDWRDGRAKSHVFEYLRRNSYIPWGHYAANMAHDAVRYRLADLEAADVEGMRHLYYQRTYLRMAEILGLGPVDRRRRLSAAELERLRVGILSRIQDEDPETLPISATLWGWNFGFDYAPSGYRLHASHQQVHQQFALVPGGLELSGDKLPGPCYACGDPVADFGRRYRKATGRPFFEAYLEAVRTNRRTDGRPDRPQGLVVFEDENCVLFVPKAQTSQWELQLVTAGQVGNVLEADTAVRRSLDRGLLLAARTLEKMGARMITTIEFSKRFGAADTDQRLLYCFMPRLPESPGAFSEAQLRWINGHYPEDFAAACRLHAETVLREMAEEKQ